MTTPANVEAERDYVITMRESEEMDREHRRQKQDQAELLLDWQDWAAPTWSGE